MSGALKGRSSHVWEREENEHYVEEHWCSRRLFDVEQFPGRVWDPFCGFGRVVSGARGAGLQAHGSDVVSRSSEFPTVHDFLGGDAPPAPFDHVVGNPPFKRFREVALIWHLRRLPAAGWLQHHPLARIYYMAPRPSMPPGYVISAGGKVGGGTQDFVWLVFDPAHCGPRETLWLHRDDEVPA